ncbi:MAG: hypothetical protein PHU07_04260 [Acidocella sp.]|nr:hypothetical protein [Acidocella sp.]
MHQLQKIDIDWDIHRLIEAERQGFDEPPFLALRRLLKLPPITTTEASDQDDTPEMLKAKSVRKGLPWVEDGVIVPHGSFARMEYDRGRQVYEGQFLNGRLVVDGESFDTLSAAASALAVTKNGKKTRLNGWEYWQVRIPGELFFKSLKQMRDQ